MLLPLLPGLFLAIPAWAETVGSPAALNVPAFDPDGGYSFTYTASPSSRVHYVLEEATDPGFAGIDSR